MHKLKGRELLGNRRSRHDSEGKWKDTAGVIVNPSQETKRRPSKPVKGQKGLTYLKQVPTSIAALSKAAQHIFMEIRSDFITSPTQQ